MNTSTTPSPEPSPAALEAAVLRALSRAPNPAIPADFAARVARQVATQAVHRTAVWTGWGPRLTIGCGALLTLALFALAPHTAPALTNVRFDAELVLFTELSALLLFIPQLLRGD